MTPEESGAWRRETRHRRHAEAFRLRAEAQRQGRTDLVNETGGKLLSDAG
jgi:hypothetical protein